MSHQQPKPEMQQKPAKRQRANSGAAATAAAAAAAAKSPAGQLAGENAPEAKPSLTASRPQPQQQHLDNKPPAMVP
eukprot:1198156-Pyramimonas_sp.AAC.1